MGKNIKLKTLLEGYAWERTPGKALPTLEDVQNAHNKGQNIKEGNSRMEGLLDQKAWKEVTANVYDIMMDFQADGFETEDIIEFLSEKLKSTIEEIEMEGM